MSFDRIQGDAPFLGVEANFVAFQESFQQSQFSGGQAVQLCRRTQIQIRLRAGATDKEDRTGGSRLSRIAAPIRHDLDNQMIGTSAVQGDKTVGLTISA